MLRYSQLNIGGGGPWFGSLAAPGLPRGGMFPKQEILSRINRGEGDENIALTGGEPLNHPEIVEIINAVKTAGYRRILVRTGGHSLADMDFLAAILKAGVSLFEVMLRKGDANMSHWRLREQYAGLRNIRRISERWRLFTNIYLSMVVPVGRDNHEGLISALNGMLSLIEVDRVVFCWGEQEFPIGWAGRNIERAIEFCGARGVWAVTRGIPVCAVPDAVYHLEELFDVGPQGQLLRTPPSCEGCCFYKLCARMPGMDLNYSWEPKPIFRHKHSPFINDIMEKGFVFDETNAHLYI